MKQGEEYVQETHCECCYWWLLLLVEEVSCVWV